MTCRSTSSRSNSWPATCCRTRLTIAADRHRFSSQHDAQRGRWNRSAGVSLLRAGRSCRHHGYRLDGHDDRLRPVPYAQIRSDHTRRLLLVDGVAEQGGRTRCTWSAMSLGTNWFTTVRMQIDEAAQALIDRILPTLAQLLRGENGRGQGGHRIRRMVSNPGGPSPTVAVDSTHGDVVHHAQVDAAG